ncbi:MAG TPA: aminotransferase class V-fold PLP-dependent enzyme [Ferruginibacter sp.]|nr:aminotransferase class V-fold PLP-dependent enzyme [Ferruginibacter sp.]
MQKLNDFFFLNKDITFLNFGSFGSCVKPVFEKYQQLQLEMEQEPVDFITNKGLQYLQQSREALAAYLNCNASDLVFVTNPSYAVNTVAKQMVLKEGDEILTTDIEYGACDKVWEFYCSKAGAKYVRQPVSFPIESKEQFVEKFFKGLTSKTKLVFLSHITSSTALRLPVEEICKKAKQYGVLTFIDGAHAPAQVPVDLSNTDIDMYTGACHKWMMTPKGSSFMYVKKALQPLEPLVVSWGYNALFPSDSLFLDYHQMNGTRDYTAFLTLPTAIDFMKAHHWWQVASNCRTLVFANALEHCNLLGAQPLSPINEDFVAQMYSANIKTKEPELLHKTLLEKYKIQVPVMRHGHQVFLRYSINAFNTQQHLDILFDAIRDIKKQGGLIE